MTTFYLTCQRVALSVGETHELRATHSALRVLDGAVKVGDTVLCVGEGSCFTASATLAATDGPSTVLEFGLWRDLPSDIAFTDIQIANLTDETVFFRLDEVSFGPGVCAYRHVHPGTGFRALIEGELTIHADDHSQVMKPGDTWFEPANSPVRAVASETAPQSTFVRAMVLPVEYLGQPTIQILDPDEAALPRLQKTRRHVDQIIQLSG